MNMKKEMTKYCIPKNVYYLSRERHITSWVEVQWARGIECGCINEEGARNAQEAHHVQHAHA